MKWFTALALVLALSTPAHAAPACDHIVTALEAGPGAWDVTCAGGAVLAAGLLAVRGDGLPTPGPALLLVDLRSGAVRLYDLEGDAFLVE